MVNGNNYSNARILIIGAGPLAGRAIEFIKKRGFRKFVVADQYSVTEDDVDGVFFFEDQVGIDYRADVLQDYFGKNEDLRIKQLNRPTRAIDGWDYALIISCNALVTERRKIFSMISQYSLPYIDAIANEDGGRVSFVTFGNYTLMQSNLSQYKFKRGHVRENILAQVQGAISDYTCDIIEGNVVEDVDGVNVDNEGNVSFFKAVGSKNPASRRRKI